MRRTAVLVVQIVGVLPDVEGEEGFEAVGDRVVGVSILGNAQLPSFVGLEPYPTASEEGCALGFELGLESVEGAPLLGDLLRQRGFRVKPGMRSGGKLREVQVMVQNLAGVVENGGRYTRCARYDRRSAGPYNLLKGLALKIRPGNQLVKIIDIGLQVLSVMESQRLVTYYRSQGLVWKVNECMHNTLLF